MLPRLARDAVLPSMVAVTPPPPLVKTPVFARAVAQSSGAIEPDNCLRGGVTSLPSAASLVLDFGEEVVGVLEMTIEASGETTLELIEGEDLEEALLLKDPFPPDHWYHQPHDILPLAAGPQVASNQGRRAFRFVNVINHGPGIVRLGAVRAILEHAPVEDRGAFNCSDDLLNQAWAISRRTLRLCLQGFYEDGVKRDGMLWIGDYRVEFLCAHYLFGDAALARRSLEMFAQCRHENGSLSAVALLAGGHMYPRIKYLGDLSTPGGLHRWVLANYCADFVSSVGEYVLHTGDVSLAHALDETTRGVLDFLGKVDVLRTKIADTFITDNQVDQENWWGSRATLAYQIAAAFADGAKIAELLGDHERARGYREQHRARLPEAAALFGDPARAESRDDVIAGSTRSWHAHAAAFLAGAITPAEMREIFPRLQSDAAVRRPMAGFMEFYLLQAWFDAGLAQAALDEMRSYYGQMLRSGATTTWELVDRRVPGIDHIVAAGRSHCHGWSAGPANLLPAKILGVVPTAPGYSRVEIRPTLGDLAWAEGEIPTPHGNISVAIRRDGTGEITLPMGVTATLCRGDLKEELAPGTRHRFRNL
ncbi:MAG: alpha-L-rhamnosidase [Verrucomicrobia bacterium]|nr:alpha-L-rhamnosidase [Verrucomicrobiota bacterium]